MSNNISDYSWQFGFRKSIDPNDPKSALLYSTESAFESTTKNWNDYYSHDRQNLGTLDSCTNSYKKCPRNSDTAGPLLPPPLSRAIESFADETLSDIDNINNLVSDQIPEAKKEIVSDPSKRAVAVYTEDMETKSKFSMLMYNALGVSVLALGALGLFYTTKKSNS